MPRCLTEDSDAYYQPQVPRNSVPPCGEMSWVASRLVEIGIKVKFGARENRVGFASFGEGCTPESFGERVAVLPVFPRQDRFRGVELGWISWRFWCAAIMHLIFLLRLTIDVFRDIRLPDQCIHSPPMGARICFMQIMPENRAS